MIITVGTLTHLKAPIFRNPVEVGFEVSQQRPSKQGRSKKHRVSPRPWNGLLRVLLPSTGKERHPQ